MAKNSALKKIVKILILFLIFCAGIGGGYFLSHKEKIPNISLPFPKNKYISFLAEVYDVIQNNYWEKISDDQLIKLYILGVQKITGQPLITEPKNRKELTETLRKAIKNLPRDEQKKEFSSQLADIVLANLQPSGRSRLYSLKQEIDLKNVIENRNPDVDQYKVLDVPKNASEEAIRKTYEEKTEELKKSASPEAKQKLAEINKAFTILSDVDNKKTYDQSGVEPTMEYKLLRPDIFYLHINKFSPTTLDELFRVSEKVDKGNILDSLILDLRDNIGGAIDGLPYFLGPFIGNEQYAYQFYHQGNREDFKTKIGWIQPLLRYKKTIVLINENTQSSAELMAAVLKKYNVGVLIGTSTRGWGTVEKVFEIKQQLDPNEKFSAFLVHRITLRDDGQPIEGRGVDPDINIKDPNWEQQLYSYFRYSEYAKVIKEIITAKSP